jgi:hypothetical protein
VVSEKGDHVWTFDSTPHLIRDRKYVDRGPESQRIDIPAGEVKELKAWAT